MLFDPYYETKVNSNWSKDSGGKIYGILLIFLGLMSISFTIADLSSGMTPQNNSAWQENSIWPTIGKGIWVGAILLTTGIIGLISDREKTQVSLYVFNGFSWVSAVFSLYLLLSSVLHVQPYLLQGYADASSRTTPMRVEIIFNSLLIATGGLGLITSLFSAVISCLSANCCVSRRKYKALGSILPGAINDVTGILMSNGYQPTTIY